VVISPAEFGFCGTFQILLQFGKGKEAFERKAIEIAGNVFWQESRLFQVETAFENL
jgi:hypothetical protein